ncbi:MAG: carbamate kinase [Anaerolineae bacterium]|nr:carbamate kinase [Anaerolineae bacterium]
MFLKAFQNEFQRRGIDKPVAAVVTQVLVSKDDPAFLKPSKPIGSFLDKATAMQRQHENGWSVVEDAGRGWRRTVPSPKPLRIIDKVAIMRLIGADFVVIGVGGGGIPVIEDGDGELVGVEAVIDKDFASALLATSLGASLLLISTAVEKVALHFGTAHQKWLNRMTLVEARAYLAQGHFAAGSMGPKIKAALSFLEHGGTEVLITNLDNIARALTGETGTRIVQA